jgi:hypothetical protein
MEGKLFTGYDKYEFKCIDLPTYHAVECHVSLKRLDEYKFSLSESFYKEFNDMKCVQNFKYEMA